MGYETRVSQAVSLVESSREPLLQRDETQTKSMRNMKRNAYKLSIVGPFHWLVRGDSHFESRRPSSAGKKCKQQDKHFLNEIRATASLAAVCPFQVNATIIQKRMFPIV